MPGDIRDGSREGLGILVEVPESKIALPAQLTTDFFACGLVAMIRAGGIKCAGLVCDRSPTYFALVAVVVQTFLLLIVPFEFALVHFFFATLVALLKFARTACLGWESLYDVQTFALATAQRKPGITLLFGRHQTLSVQVMQVAVHTMSIDRHLIQFTIRTHRWRHFRHKRAESNREIDPSDFRTLSPIDSVSVKL